MKKNRLVLVFVVLLVALLTAQCSGPTTGGTATEGEKVYKVAAIFPGVITDADYNTLAYVGVTELQKNRGVETAYSETVAVPDVERVMREYIDNGFNIIWTHGGQFVNQTVELAPQFPEVIFIAEGDAPVENPSPNLWFIDRNFHTGFYAIGALAARATTSGKIGYLGGVALPFTYAEIHAIQQAIKDSGKNVELVHVFAGDLNDPAKGRQVTDAMIAQGVDVIMGSLNLGMQGVFQGVAAAPHKVLVTVKYTDKSESAVDNYMTSLLYDFTKPLDDIYTKILAGETGGYYPLGFDTGVSLQQPIKNVDPAIVAEVDQIIADIQSGAIEVVKDISEVK